MKWLGRFASVAFIFMFASVSAQPSPPSIAEAFEKREFVSARRLMARVMHQEPQVLLDHIEDVEFMILELNAKGGEEVARKPQTDTLIRLYDLGATSRPHEKAAWLARKAMLASRFPEIYGSQTLTYLETAIFISPLECPLTLFYLWQEEVKRRSSGKTDAFATRWFRLDRLLYLRSVFNPEEAEDCIRMEQALSHRMAAILPTCISLQSAWMATPFSQLTEEKTLNFLTASHLGRCDDSLSWNKAMQWLLARKIERADVARILAIDAMERRDYADATAFWSKAIALETDAEAIAGDLLFLGEIRKLQGDYAESRAHFEEAIRRMPSWGEPYIRLADLYRDGVAECRLSTFDAKALNWLLIDLCRKAAQADPSYEDEARTRISVYRSHMPTREDLELRQLMDGDTWPLKCWMSTAVMVQSP